MSNDYEPTEVEITLMKLCNEWFMANIHMFRTDTMYGIDMEADVYKLIKRAYAIGTHKRDLQQSFTCEPIEKYVCFDCKYASSLEPERKNAAVKAAVQAFLGWRLPDDFNPDAGINFDPVYNKGTQWENRHTPIGTNLFSVDQATAMFEYCLRDREQSGDEKLCNQNDRNSQ